MKSVFYFRFQWIYKMPFINIVLISDNTLSIY
jgi:hypothetical protein